ncbi:hypothetical protein K2Q00_02060 [Patescibacteria group bacterium]|nr:hypothetical protein [Patescibacteria group bacterium]
MADQNAEYPYPVWGTDQGGVVRRRKPDGIYIFVKAPGHSGLAFGDTLPDGWNIAPANEAARRFDEIGNFQVY